jgi:hypothetical protein
VTPNAIIIAEASNEDGMTAEEKFNMLFGAGSGFVA